MVAQPGSGSLGPLVGRTAELAAIHAALADARLVTLTGLGGTGKTRLARAFSESRPGDEVTTFIDLSSVAHASDVAPAIGAAIGVGDVEVGDLESALGAALDRLPACLLVLDNFEHVLPAGRVVTSILDSAPRVRVLATSRVRLGVAGELAMPLEPLGTPATVADLDTADASRLFLHRARERGRLAALDPAEAEGVVAVCRRLDGLPLAIELAASWTRLLSPRAIERRLEAGRLRLGPGVVARQATLERVVDATLELVEPADGAAFEALSVFVAGFDEAGARGLLRVEEVLPLLGRLEGVALLRSTPGPDGEPRFTMLETIRAVGAARLAARADAPEVRRGFVALCAARAQIAADELRDLQPAAALAWLTVESPNLRSALDAAMVAPDPPLAVQLAMTLATYGVRAGSARESLRRLRAAMALGPVPAGIRSEALCAVLNLCLMVREPLDVDAMAREAVALARQAGDVRRELRALIALGSNDPSPDGVALLADAVELARTAGYVWAELAASDNLASHYANMGRWKDALGLFMGSLESARATLDGEGLGYVLANVAELNAFLGRPEAGLEFARRATAVLGASWPSSHTRAWALSTQAVCEALLGRGPESCRTLVAGCDVATTAEAEVAATEVLRGAATVLVDASPELVAQVAGRLARLAEEDPDVSESNGPLLPAAVDATRRRLGPSRYAAAFRAGRDLDPWRLVAEVRAIAGASHAAGSRLRTEFGTLTPRETEVLGPLSEGRSDQEIADALGISAKTASVHVANIKAKLGAGTRIEAAVRARDLLGARDERAGTDR